MGRRGIPRWIAVGVWAGIGLALMRLSLVFAMDHFGRGLDESMTRWRVAERATWVVAWAIATGIACAWVLKSSASAARTSAGAPAPSSSARTVRVAFVTAAICAVLTGWPFDDAFHVPGPGSTRGLVTLVGLAVASLVLAAALTMVVRRRSSEHGARPSSLSFALASVIAATVVIAARFVAGAPGESMVVRVVESDLTVDPSVWQVERSRDSALPRAQSLTPSLDVRLDGGELPALVMPPPYRMTYVVRDDEIGLRFHAAAGCDATVPNAFDARGDAPTIVFRVRVGDGDGERVVMEHRRTPWSGEDAGDALWARLGGGDGLDVEPGDRLTLETEFEGAAPSADALAAAATVGFGGLVLERRYERPRTRATPEAPNIVLVVMDTLRADRTSLHGYERPTTPVLDALAARGTTFENAFATSSWTWPSTASILSGLEPGEHGVVSEAECYLADEFDTLPEALQREGFTTCAFACNPLVAPSRNFDGGFETFEFTVDSFLTSDQVMPSILGWLDAHASTRFFLYLHLVDPHELHRSNTSDRARFAGPLPEGMSEHALHEYAGRLLAGEHRAPDGTWRPESVVSPEHLRWLRDAYDAAVATGDRALGSVLERIDALSLRDNTLVVFTSDHGEEFLEHGHMQHGQSLHTELVHVPLVMAGPGVAPGVRSAQPVSNRHLASTLARVGGARIEGIDPVDLRLPIAAEPLFLATESGWWNGDQRVAVRALRDGNWSLHCRLDVEGAARLYDLAADPGELVDVAASHPERVTEMRARIAAHERESQARGPRAVRAGAGTLELLRATGYAGEDH